MLKEDTNSSNNDVFFNIDVDSLDNTVTIPNDIYVKLDLNCILNIPEINKSLNLELKVYANFKDKTNTVNTNYKLLPLELHNIKTDETKYILTSNNIQDETDDNTQDKIDDNTQDKINDNTQDETDDKKHENTINFNIPIVKHDISIQNIHDQNTLNDDLENYRNKLNTSIEFLEDYNREEELKKISIVMNNLHEYISNFSDKMNLNSSYDNTDKTYDEDKPKDTFNKYLNDVTDENINNLDYNIIKQLIYHYTLLNNDNMNTENSIIHNLIELMKFVTNFNIENMLKKEYVITALKIIYKDTDKHKFIQIIENQLIDNIIKLDKSKVKIKGHKDCNIV